MSVRVVVQCKAHTRDGRRCQRRTGKTDLCYQHLDKEYHVRVKPSQIPRSGMGLYTTVPRRRGQVISPYTGDILVNPRDNQLSPYALQVKKHPPTFIDAKRTNTGSGRYANNCRHGQCTNNAHLRPGGGALTANVKASRNIPAGREVLASYGNQYWRSQ
jgi:hypothetical protein